MCFVFFVMCCIIFHFIDGITCVYLEYMEYSCIFSNVLRCCFFLYFFGHGLYNVQFYRGITCIYLQYVNMLECFLYCCVFCHS